MFSENDTCQGKDVNVKREDLNTITLGKQDQSRQEIDRGQNDNVRKENRSIASTCMRSPSPIPGGKTAEPTYIAHRPNIRFVEPIPTFRA